MKPPEKFNPLFDRFLLGGLGCGMIALCFLMATFFYIWQNPPRPRAETTPLAVGGLSTNTPEPTPTPLFQFSTPSAFPTGLTPLTPVGPGTPIATPTAPPFSSFANAELSGKIVFTCFVNQIDQVCLMNADGSERKQLTQENATSFYASLSFDGDTIYFVSRRTGSFEIYSMNTRGNGLRRLTKNIGSVYAPERSPIDD